MKTDLNDVESVEDAFKGIYGVFVVTNCMSATSVRSRRFPLVLLTKYNQVSLGSCHLQRGEGGCAGKTARRRSEGGGREAFCIFVREPEYHYSLIERSIFISHCRTLEEWNDPPVEHFNAKYRINSYLIESGVPRTSYVLMLSYYMPLNYHLTRLFSPFWMQTHVECIPISTSRTSQTQLGSTSPSNLTQPRQNLSSPIGPHYGRTDLFQALPSLTRERMFLQLSRIQDAGLVRAAVSQFRFVVSS